MALPTPDWNGVKLRWRGVDLLGIPLQGFIRVQATIQRFVDAEDPTSTVILGREIVKDIDPTGYCEFIVPATDDPDIEPHDFVYQITEEIAGGGGAVYYVEAERDAMDGGAPGVDLNKRYEDGTTPGNPGGGGGGGGNVGSSYIVYNPETGLYPARPVGDYPFVFIGPTEPTDWLDGDVWINDAEDGSGATLATLDGNGILDEDQIPDYLSRVSIKKLAPKPDFTHLFKFPMYIGHRGARNIHGEHSREAYQYCAENGFPIELDLYYLADGGIACCHDATTGRTMVNITGSNSNVNVSSITSREWKRDWRILPLVAGADLEQPMLLEDVLDLYGGRCLIVPELKDTQTREAVVAAVEARGLEKAVLLQSFNLADVQYSGVRGIPSMRLGGSEPPATFTASGIFYTGLPFDTTTDARVNALVAGGVKVLAYTVNERYTATTGADALLARGFHGMFSDDPAWVSGRMAQSYSDPFRKRIPYAHTHITAGGAGAFTSANVHFRNGGIGLVQPGGTGLARVIGQDWCPRIISGKALIDFDVIHLPNTLADSSRWFGFAFGQILDDRTYVDGNQAGQNVFHFIFRRSGALQLYTNFAGTGPVQVAATQGTVTMTNLQEKVMKFRLIRDAAGITVTNRENGESVTYANTTEIWPNSRFAFSVNTTSAIIKNVHVTPL